MTVRGYLTKYWTIASVFLPARSGSVSCSLMGVKRTLHQPTTMSAFDPKQTFGPEEPRKMTVGPHSALRKSLL